MKVKNFFRTKWQYILVFLIPWILVLIHSVFRESWPLGSGSILIEDASGLYVQLYSELWEKIHNGGSLAFSWSSGLGINFGIDIFRYLMSPCTLLMLAAPKAWIANMVQICMVLKWSLLSVSMLYYVSHTKHNTLKSRRKLTSIVLAMAYFLGNTALSVLDNLALLDVMILFPVLLLLEERLAEQKNYKRFYILFTLCILMNYTLAIPLAIFLAIWFALQFDENTPCSKKCVFSYIMVYVAAIMTGMLVLIPGLMSGIEGASISEGTLLSIAELVQRFFVCDSLWLSQDNQPMLYCSVVIVILALLYVFTKDSFRKKIGICTLALLLVIGLLTKTGNLVWNGGLGVSQNFAFLLTFIMLFMAMGTLNQLETIRMRHVIVSGIIAIVGMVYGFLKAVLMLDFYVYLATLLIAVFLVLMLIFYCKKSIQYRNVLVVFAVVALLEFVTNAFYQLQLYNEYTIESLYYHKDAETLSSNLVVSDGEKVVATQVLHNYGMTLQLPTVCTEHATVSSNIGNLYKALGMDWSKNASGMLGGSPLLNVMFNVRYGLGQNEMAFSDCEKIKSTNEYNLYEMNRLAGLGYMVDSQIVDWDWKQESPFDVQNDFVRKSTGKGDIFEILTPDLTCYSLLGYNPDAEAHHHHEDGEECEEEHENDTDSVYQGKYLENGVYYYQLEKMFSEDYVYTTFTSDGVSDYYIYLDGSSPNITYVRIGEEYVYWEQLASEQKTIHIGVIPEGEQISVISDFQVDDLAFAEMRYQVAAFHEENYSPVYDELSKNTLQITSMADTCMEGTITADTAGVMMTGVPVIEGMSVIVDGEVEEYKVIGNALIGIPLTEGEHVIEIMYTTPYVLQGVMVCTIGLLMFICFAVGWKKCDKKEG